MPNAVWIGPVAVTALSDCLVLPPGDRAWVDVLVGAGPDADVEAEVRQAMVQYQLQVDGFGSFEPTGDRAVRLERTARRLERELTRQRGVRLMTFRPITA